MIEKAPDAYRTISEVAEDLDLPQHVLRFWETRFSQIKPLKRGGGRRYYRPDDVELLKGIRHLLYAEGYTIKGVQRILKEQGPKAVMGVAQGLAPPLAGDDDFDDEEAGDGMLADVAPRLPPPQPVMRSAAPPQAYQAAPQRFEPPLAPAPQAPPPQAYAPPPAPQDWPPVEYAAPAYPPPPPVYAAPPRLPEPAYEPPPPPAAVPAAPPPRAPSAVSYMRGGLSNPLLGRKPVMPAAPESPAPGQGINVRRPAHPAAPPPEPLPARFAPVPEDEIDQAPAYPVRMGLSEDSRRALQSALFELTECRRTIERVIAARER